MKITKKIVVVFFVTFFVLGSVGILLTRKEPVSRGAECLNPHYPCVSLPLGFTGWPNFP
ncbi:hypothetical protein SAMN03159391_04936 [Pseudomonas sp. NFACC37-1]|nr:hypothetical protein SAMN03159391_04936 [Pseudomonas sp. NFACC37-1]SFO82546.1 hypothetical protein SAMN03159304_05211 [Pseudomonas sp. NFACC24-1]